MKEKGPKVRNKRMKGGVKAWREVFSFSIKLRFGA